MNYSLYDVCQVLDSNYFAEAETLTRAWLTDLVPASQGFSFRKGTEFLVKILGSEVNLYSSNLG